MPAGIAVPTVFAGGIGSAFAGVGAVEIGGASASVPGAGGAAVHTEQACSSVFELEVHVSEAVVGAAFAAAFVLHLAGEFHHPPL